MSLINLVIALLGLLVGVLITLTFMMVRKLIPHKHEVSQKIIASENSQVTQVRQTQASRDVIAIDTYTHTQIIPDGTFFLAESEQVAVSKDLQEFESQVSTLWNAATKYIYGVSLYGHPFMPFEAQLEAILSQGIELKMVLVDPKSSAAVEIAQDKCRFSRPLRLYEVLAQRLQIEDLTSDHVLERICDEVDLTVNILRKLNNPLVHLRMIDFLPTWKGTIIDGQSGVYLIYDVPRMDVPFRWTNNPKIIKFYEDHYFYPYWNAGREIALT